MKSERIKSGRGKVGPGGLRCDCCGGAGGRRRASHKRGVRKFVRGIRRADRADAIADGLDDLDAIRADAEKAEQEAAMWKEHEAAA
jgi:hypothetical protein